MKCCLWKWVLFLLLSSVFSWARIGETKEEIRSRYGAGKEIGDDQILFTILDCDVTVTFRENRSFREIYTPRVGHDDKLNPMTMEIVKKLLGYQRVGVLWNQADPDTSGKILFVSSDLKVYAHFHPAYHSLTFEGPQTNPKNLESSSKPSKK